MANSNWYYHAGCVQGDCVIWSDHTRKSCSTADAEAKAMARTRPGFQPIVEYWRREHGMRPEVMDLVSGFYFADEHEAAQ